MVGQGGAPSILCFSTVDWDYLWHRPQAVMQAFAQDGWQVLYVDTLGLRSPKIRDLPRMASRLRNRLRAGGGGLCQPSPGVQVFSPLVLPFLDSSLARRLNVAWLVPRLQGLLRESSDGGLIIWVYLPTWTVLQCVQRIPHQLLVYECIDALEANPAGVSLGYEAAEAEILRRADLVVTTSQELCQSKARHNPNTHWVPPGVSEYFFGQGEPAPELTGMRGPRVGFFGTIDHRIDLELLGLLARAHPDWSFVLIGVVRRDLSALVKQGNVHLLGPKAHGELPALLRGLDVLLLPYVADEFTLHVFPAKIYEALAAGMPVVATALPALEEFGRVVRLGEGFDEVDAALREAVAEDDAELRVERVELARGNSWEGRYREIRGYVEEALAR